MGGRKIDDHSFWAGGKSKGSVFPEGAKTAEYTSAEGEGAVAMYEDTTEAIKSQQLSNKSQMRSKPMKSGYRN